MKVRLNRLLYYLNWLIGLLLVVVLGAIYWFAYRVLPKTSGSLNAPIMAALTITRDGLGVPHIKAASVEDALFAQGFVHAQDRLWQMDALRRLAAGELSEVVGKAALASDLDSRRLRMRRIAEAAYTTLPPQDRAAMVAYARGVNYFLETHQGTLPVEFKLLGYQPRPWSVVDSLLAGLQMYRDMTSTAKGDLAMAVMTARGDKAKLEYLFSTRAGSELPPGASEQPGSNAFALSGEWTASGKPLLASDPHLSWGLPSPWYLNHLQASGLNVSGSSLPGVPCIIIGHNERIAWGVTNLHFDVQDLYWERLNAQTGQYLFEGKVEQAIREREVIRIKGEKTQEFNNWVTRHGPLWSSDANGTLSLRWIAAEPGAVTFPFLQLNQAENFLDFTNALRRFGGPGQNFVYADVYNNIGYQAAGFLPRRGFSGSSPAEGWTGQNEWQGLIPFEDLPSAFNPPSGVVVTANQNPFPANNKHQVSGEFAPHYRSRQILSLLNAKKGWKVEDLLIVQKDVYSAFSHFLAKRFVAASDKRGGKNADLQQAISLLRNWNGQMDKDGAAPLIVTLAYTNLRRMVGEKAAGQAGPAYEYQLAPALIERLLREQPVGWFSDYDSVLLRALTDGIEEGRRQQGRNPDVWRFGQYTELTVKHPVIGKIPFVGKYYDVGPVLMSGSVTTVKQTSKRLGPSMRMIADTADWDKSLQSIPFGQSGQLLSSHFKDQWDNYYVGLSSPMRFKDVEGSVLELRPSKR